MCWGCVVKYVLDLGEDDQAADEQIEGMVLPPQTPEMLRLGALVEEFYALPECSVGGPLHVVTDDYNVEDDSIAFCERSLDDHWSIERQATDEGREVVRAKAREIIALMRPMTLAERAVALYERGDERGE